MLEIQAVTKTYPRASRPVLNGASLSVARGETVALTGESGSGKSTLLHLAGALDAFDTGEITLLDQAYSTLDDAGRAALRRNRIGLVFQQFNLIPSLTVAQNLHFHARLAGRLDPAWMQQVTARLGLSEITGAYPEQISGGQQQRVAIGRALAARPDVLLADEPTGNLDETTSDAVLALMLDVVADAGTALLLVTHSPRIAGQLSRRVHLTAGQIA